ECSKEVEPGGVVETKALIPSLKRGDTKKRAVSRQLLQFDDSDMVAEPVRSLRHEVSPPMRAARVAVLLNRNEPMIVASKKCSLRFNYRANGFWRTFHW